MQEAFRAQHPLEAVNRVLGDRKANPVQLQGKEREALIFKRHVLVRPNGQLDLQPYALSQWLRLQKLKHTADMALAGLLHRIVGGKGMAKKQNISEYMMTFVVGYFLATKPAVVSRQIAQKKFDISKIKFEEYGTVNPDRQTREKFINTLNEKYKKIARDKLNKIKNKYAPKEMKEKIIEMKADLEDKKNDEECKELEASYRTLKLLTGNRLHFWRCLAYLENQRQCRDWSSPLLLLAPPSFPDVNMFLVVRGNVHCYSFKACGDDRKATQMKMKKSLQDCAEVSSGDEVGPVGEAESAGQDCAHSDVQGGAARDKRGVEPPRQVARCGRAPSARQRQNQAGDRPGGNHTAVTGEPERAALWNTVARLCHAVTRSRR